MSEESRAPPGLDTLDIMMSSHCDIMTLHAMSMVSPWCVSGRRIEVTVPQFQGVIICCFLIHQPPQCVMKLTLFLSGRSRAVQGLCILQYVQVLPL